MNEVNEQALVAFDQFLGSLGDDTQSLLDAVNDESQSRDVRYILAGALNYFFKSLDLIDDGIEGLGYIDDAFVIRVACAQAAQGGHLPDALFHLAQDAQLIATFLADLNPRLHTFVRSLGQGSVRGRTAEAIVSDSSVRGELTVELVTWAARYKKPQFVLDEHGLIKLRAFLGARLPV